MKYLLVLIAMASVACASCNDVLNGGKPMFSAIDPLLVPYFDIFTNITGVGYYGITAGLTPLDNNIAGQCVLGGTYSEIRIDSNSWNRWTINQKQQLISHELGHCALGLGHINQCSDGTTALDGVDTSCNNGLSQPLSIMNWMMFTPFQANNIGPEYYKALKLNKYVGE